MKPVTIKFRKRLKISEVFAILYVSFWQIETWYFIWADGWHWRAISESEKTCDSIASIFLMISATFFISLLYDIARVFRYATVTISDEKDYIQ